MMAKPSAAEINSKSLSNSANEDISVEENPATATITGLTQLAQAIAKI
jgi:hypothetical protein